MTSEQWDPLESPVRWDSRALTELTGPQVTTAPLAPSVSPATQVKQVSPELAGPLALTDLTDATETKVPADAPDLLDHLASWADLDARAETEGLGPKVPEESGATAAHPDLWE